MYTTPNSVSDAISVIRFRLPEGVDVRALPLPAGVDVEISDGVVSFCTDSLAGPLMKLLGWTSARGIELRDLTVTRASFEDGCRLSTAEGAA